MEKRHTICRIPLLIAEARGARLRIWTSMRTAGRFVISRRLGERQGDSLYLDV